MPAPFPAAKDLKICFAHAAYRMGDRFAARNTGIAFVEVRTSEDLLRAGRDADIVCTSMMWRNELLDAAPRLKYVQSISAGTDQYDKAKFTAKGVRLASGAGVNARAVAHHAMALTLALARHLHTGRDNQAAKTWRGMISDIAAREDEMTGRTMVIVGAGRIGGALARIAKAFEMRVIAVKRDVATPVEGADVVHPVARLAEVLPEADVVVLACPLTPETENLIGPAALARLKPSAHLVNVARGKVVDEAALIEALAGKRFAAAALDVTREEPLVASSPLWTMPNVLLTPHTAGETQRYEDNVLDILLENIGRLSRGETSLQNEVA
jgi:phosphoglycerate dehydrogenase-like enzyme